MKAYTLGELRERAKLSEKHAEAFHEAVVARRWFCENPNLTPDECVSGADEDGHTYNALGEALDGYETLSDWPGDEQARIVAMEGGAA